MVNKKSIIKIVLFCMVLFISIFQKCIFFESNAANPLSTDEYTKIYNTPSGSDKVDNLGKQILGVIDAVASVVAVIMLVWIGLKYITSSPAEKADLKDGKLTLYVIGAVLLFGGSRILDIIANSFWA